MSTHRTHSTHAAQAQHTPGPWVFSNAGGWGGSCGLPYLLTTDHDKPGREEKLIAAFPLTFPDRDGMKTEERRANARLIAAAPELLEALEELLGFAEDYGPSDRANHEDWSGYFDAARAAIAKARGQ